MTCLVAALRTILSNWLGGGQHPPQTVSKAVHCARWIIGGHVGHGVFAGGFFQHVCGNSEPVSAV